MGVIVGDQEFINHENEDIQRRISRIKKLYLLQQIIAKKPRALLLLPIQPPGAGCRSSCNFLETKII